MRPSALLARAALGLVAFLWAGWRWIDERRYRSELEQIERTWRADAIAWPACGWSSLKKPAAGFERSRL